MKIELKNKIEKLISNYKKITTEFLNQIAKWEADQLYSADTRGQKIREVKAQMQANDMDFNNQLKTIITEEQNVIQNFTIKKPDDFQLQISNAIGFINLHGDKLTDEQSFELVKPFFGDYQTMRYFHSVLANKPGLGVTIISLGLLDRAINYLDALKNNFTLFFDNGTYSTNSLGFVIGSEALVSDAESIESIVQKLDSIIPASYKEVKTELDKEVEIGVK
jgi:hypothetical protein